MNSLPMELLHLIAETDELTYRTMLAVPFFARSITVGKMLDYMVLFRHDVKITDGTIRRHYDERLHRGYRGDESDDKYIIKWLYHELEPTQRIGTAVGWTGGGKWYRDVQLHREDGPAVEYGDGSKEWYRNRERYREDGPAIEWTNGYKEWYHNGQLHREDGPAVEHANGSKEWYRHGQQYYPQCCPTINY